MTDAQRKPLTTYKGVVDSKSGDQTIRVVMGYTYKHKKYGKTLKRQTVAHVHDAENKAAVGDVVQICKCRPMSKTKHWRLLEILETNA